MKVLVSAVACNPYLGSENYFGWAAVKALARDHELWVLTGPRNIPDLQKAKSEGLVPDNVHFVFAGQCAPWHPNRMRARMQGWREYMGFCQAIYPVAKQLHEKERFNVVHHVTFATWRVASPLGKLGIPFIFGPVGGYEQFPLRFLGILSPAAAAFELARIGSNIASRSSLRVRQCLRSAAHVFVANKETGRLVESLRGNLNGVSELSPGFFSDVQIERFARFVPGKANGGTLRLFAGGNLEGRKGVALALTALAAAKRSGVQFQYQLGAQGPEMAHLKQLTHRLGLQDNVVFATGFHGEAYQQELGKTHIFMLPSFRESAGLTMMEAMLAGCVPIVADCGGPGTIVTEECGFKIPITNPHQMVKDLAEIIITLHQEPALVAKKGQQASRRIATHFSEVLYLNSVNNVYQSVVNTRKIQ